MFDLSIKFTKFILVRNVSMKRIKPPKKKIFHLIENN